MTIHNIFVSFFLSIIIFSIQGCSKSPEDQFLEVCNQGGYSNKENYKFQGTITNIDVGKVGNKAHSGFSLSCQGSRSFSFVWFDGDLSGFKPYSDVIVTVKNGQVTDVSEASGFVGTIFKWLFYGALIGVAFNLLQRRANGK